MNNTVEYRSTRTESEEVVFQELRRLLRASFQPARGLVRQGQYVMLVGHPRAGSADRTGLFDLTCTLLGSRSVNWRRVRLDLNVGGLKTGQFFSVSGSMTFKDIPIVDAEASLSVATPAEPIVTMCVRHGEVKQDVRCTAIASWGENNVVDLTVYHPYATGTSTSDPTKRNPFLLRARGMKDYWFPDCGSETANVLTFPGLPQDPPLIYELVEVISEAALTPGQTQGYLHVPQMKMRAFLDSPEKDITNLTISLASDAPRPAALSLSGIDPEIALDWHREESNWIARTRLELGFAYAWAQFVNFIGGLLQSTKRR